MFPKFFWSILIPFFAFLFGGGPRRALLESSEASADLGEGDWKIQTRSGEFMHPHGLKSCLLAPLLFCSPRFLFRSELICCAHLDSSEGLFGWDVCWKCRLGRVHASRAPKTPLLTRIRSLIMSLFFLFRGLFLAEFIRDTHFDSGEGYSGRGWGCKCDLGKFSSAPCTKFVGCLRAHVFCSLNL